MCHFLYADDTILYLSNYLRAISFPKPGSHVVQGKFLVKINFENSEFMILDDRKKVA